MTKKISVIGGAGFVGTNFCEKLSREGKEFEIIDLKVSNRFPDNSKIADVRNYEELENCITGEVVVLLAAVHRDNVSDKQEYYQTNVKGAENVLKACVKKNVSQIIFTSSVAVYGFASPGIDEQGEINPFNDYGKSKFFAENVISDFVNTGDRSVVIVRPTVIFGEGNRGNVHNLFQQIALRRFVMIGNGKNKKSIAYIENVVQFLFDCLSLKKGLCVFNYVDTPNLTMNELVSYVRHKFSGKFGVGPRVPFAIGLLIGVLFDTFSFVTKKKFPISAIRVKKFVSHSEFKFNHSNLENFKPSFTIFEGIDRTLESDFFSPDVDKEIFYSE